MPRVQQRDAEIIKLRNLTSAATTAHCAVQHLKDWTFCTQEADDWISVGVKSNGNNYGIPDDLFFSFPFTTKTNEDGTNRLEMVEGLDLDDECSQHYIEATVNELLEDRRIIEKIL